MCSFTTKNNFRTEFTIQYKRKLYLIVQDLSQYGAYKENVRFSSKLSLTEGVLLSANKSAHTGTLCKIVETQVTYTWEWVNLTYFYVLVYRIHLQPAAPCAEGTVHWSWKIVTSLVIMPVKFPVWGIHRCSDAQIFPFLL